jgi:tetratricopeptide (TPR) repeat protein
MSTVTFNINPHFAHFLHDHKSNHDLEEMQEYEQKMPLGLVLQNADLVSPSEIQIALEDQVKYHLKIGEILAQKGWIKQETADFFATKWEMMIEQVKNGEAKYKLGESLKEAGLLTDSQLQELLKLQKQENLIFGELIVQKGFLRKNTVDLFVKNLCFYNHKSFDLQAEDALRSIRKLVFVRDYKLAILELRNALKKHPHHAGLHALLAIVFVKTKQLSMAKVHLAKAQRMDEKDELVKEAQGLLKMYEHNFTATTTSLDQKFSYHPQATQKSTQVSENIFQKTVNSFKRIFSKSVNALA